MANLAQKRTKIPAHHIILGNFWLEKLTMKFALNIFTSLPLLVHIQTPTPGPTRPRGDPPSYHPIKSPTTTSSHRRQSPRIVFYQLLKKIGSDIKMTKNIPG